MFNVFWIVFRLHDDRPGVGRNCIKCSCSSRHVQKWTHPGDIIKYVFVSLHFLLQCAFTLNNYFIKQLNFYKFFYHVMSVIPNCFVGVVMNSCFKPNIQFYRRLRRPGRGANQFSEVQLRQYRRFPQKHTRSYHHQCMWSTGGDSTIGSDSSHFWSCKTSKKFEKVRQRPTSGYFLQSTVCAINVLPFLKFRICLQIGSVRFNWSTRNGNRNVIINF